MAGDDRDAVRAANQAFYRAFANLDAEAMTAVWRQQGAVTCTHPGWQRLIGWGSVLKSWEDIFAGAFGMKIEIQEELVEVRGEVAWVSCTEVLETHLPDGVSQGMIEATNVFERHQGKWLLVHHHGSPLARRQTPDDDLQLH